MGLVTHHFLFKTEVKTPLVLDEHSGSALRGNLFEAVWRRFCTNKDAPTCAECPLHTMCPVSALVAPLREENIRGRDIPRPYIIIPPIEGARCYAPGETLTFGLTLFGKIVELLPYIILSLPMLETVGLGRKVKEADWRRGTFTIKRIEAYHPLRQERQVIYEAGRAQVTVAPLAVSMADVKEKAETLPADTITLDFLTPTRLIEQEHPVSHAEFRPLIHRLLERFHALEGEYGVGDEHELLATQQYVELAEQIRCVHDATYWEDVGSYSRRTRRLTPIGGIRGQATFRGNLLPFRSLLVWGELIHVGKNAVKGNGWYTITS